MFMRPVCWRLSKEIGLLTIHSIVRVPSKVYTLRFFGNGPAREFEFAEWKDMRGCGRQPFGSGAKSTISSWRGSNWPPANGAGGVSGVLGCSRLFALAWSRFSLRDSLFDPFNIDDKRDAAVAKYGRLNVAARTNRASPKNFASDT